MRQYLPVGGGEFSRKLAIEPQTTISDVLKRLRVPEDLFKVLLLNGSRADAGQILKPVGVLSVLPPVGGG